MKSNTPVFYVDFVVKNLFLLLAFLGVNSGFSQQATASLDRDSIKIGEQIIYTITVETSADDQVVFPEDQSFVPLEMVEAFKIDTSQIEPKLRLTREYALTQFDSGSYVIPPQFIQLKEGELLTDSLKVEVHNVEVDTTKQKLFPAKNYIEVKRPFSIPSWVWKSLVSLLILAGLVYLIYLLWKRKKEKAENLPPYEQALKSLQELDESPLIKERNLREYYSILTNISRRYLEDKVEVRALEYTTRELVDELQQMKNAGKINLSQETISDFKQILERADLAKFARSQPDVLTAKEDRKFIQGFTDEVNTAIPEPTEEDLMQNQAYLEKQAKKRKKLKIIAGVILGILVVAAGISTLIATKGYDYVKDTYFGHPSKDLLESEWVTSKYGYPPVSLTTPDVLVRGEIEIAEKAQKMLEGNESFSLGGIYGNFYMVVSTLEFKEETEFDLATAVDGIYENLEAKGAYNILTKESDYETLDGVKGKKVSGSFAIENPFTKQDIKKEYQILNFGEMGGYQQITMIYDAEDSYAEEIVQRILNSVELKNIRN
ncbi:MAG: BatD family protein [Bacteroidota bacterium]